MYEDTPSDRGENRRATPLRPAGGPVPVGVKIGSTRTVLVFPAADGGLQVVRTLTCLASYENPITGEQKYAYGDEAAAEYPERVRFPLRSGLPDAGEQTDRTSNFFDAVVNSHDVPAESVVVYATPASGDESGQANLRRVLEESAIGQAGIERYPEGLCGSIPAFGDGLEAVGEIFFCLNLGSTTTECGAYWRGEQSRAYRTGNVSGNEIDRKIVSNVENESQSRVHIDINTAREYKEQYADFEQFEPVTDTIQQPGGGRHELRISWSIMDPVEAYLDGVVEAFTTEFLPQVANSDRRLFRSAIDEQIVLTGGMACVPGLVEEFEAEVSARLDREITAVAPNRADIAATVGAYRIADRMSR